MGRGFGFGRDNLSLRRIRQHIRIGKPIQKVMPITMIRLTREESRERTRSRLRAAAMREFARCGFAGTSAESIAEAAGFSGGAFYSNYRSKQEILVDVMRAYQAAETEQWARIISEGRTVDEIIDELARRAEQFARQQEWLLMKVELELRAARSEEFRLEYAKYRTELRAQALLLLRGLFARAGKRMPENEEMLADAWLAFSIGIGLYYVAESQSASREALRTQVFVPFLQNMVAQGEPLAEPGAAQP